MDAKNDLAAVTAQVEALKKILENTKEITDLLKKYPGLTFQYPGLFREKNISAKTIADKVIEIVIPQLSKMTALKISERRKLEKQIEELEGGSK